MLSEIGSNFWLDPSDNYNDGKKVYLKDYGLDGTDYVLLSTGRSAEGFVLDEISKRNPKIKKVALIPPFTCGTVIEPFLKRRYEIHTYNIDRKLFTPPGLLQQAIEKAGAGVVLFHRYFGFDTFKGCKDVIDAYRKRGVVFIEDKTQCLYSRHQPLDADYVIGSFRKWAGLPDGAYALCRDGGFSQKPCGYDYALTNAKLAACYLKHKYIIGHRGDKGLFLDQYRVAEKILDAQDQYYEMSPVSESVQANLDIKFLIQRRRWNYGRLYKGLANVEWVHIITPELGVNDVPLYFAMLLSDRDAVQAGLRENSIYAPTVWPKSGAVPQICGEAEKMYSSALCLPIDQRYGENEMDRILYGLMSIHTGMARNGFVWGSCI